MRGIFFDKTGKQIREFDVLKVFHFTGSRLKKHYMYKWVRLNDRGELAIMHLGAHNETSVPLRACGPENGVIEDAEIVQSDGSNK